MVSAKSARHAQKKKEKKKVRTRAARKNLHKIALAVGLFFVASLFLGALALYKFVNQGFTSAMSPTSYSISDDPTPTFSYIVVDSLKASPPTIVKAQFFIEDKNAGKLVSYNISPEMQLDVPGKFGVEQFKKIFALGNLEYPNDFTSQIGLVNDAIFKVFAFKVDKYILVDSTFDKQFSSFWDSGGLSPLLSAAVLQKLTGHLKTSMSIQDFYNTSQFIQSLTADGKVSQDLDHNVLVDTDDLDSDIRDITIDSLVAGEKKTIAILNGAGVAGLATFGSRVVGNLGGRIISVDNTNQTYTQSYIIADDTSSSTVATLAHVFKIKNIITKEKAGSFNESAILRSDITLILGVDTADKL
jgi:hypothetical protein